MTMKEGIVIHISTAVVKAVGPLTEELQLLLLPVEDVEVVVVMDHHRNLAMERIRLLTRAQRTLIQRATRDAEQPSRMVRSNQQSKRK